ncbi:repetin-like [Anopheles stephensi]|uniref:repetin-like n=1 Tax=Anopheles stephensi TaxID=30069 RepID=UPI001658BC18|nr:repetin-like [Anopheles stephensi]XP_035902100.1 repetin-like [Anopheles stephensi]
MTGGGNPRFTTLNELLERIAVITNIRNITARIEGSLCIGIRTEKRNEIDQPGQSHHSQATDQQDSSHHNQPTEQPGPSNHSQSIDQPESSQHSQPTEQLGPSNHSQPIDQPESSQHSQPSEQLGPSNHSQSIDQPESSHHSQYTEQPDLSHHSQGNRNQSEPPEQKKTAAKTATSKLAEFQTKVLQQTTNKHLREISDSLKMLTKGTLGFYEEMLNYMKNNK